MDIPNRAVLPPGKERDGGSESEGGGSGGGGGVESWRTRRVAAVAAVLALIVLVTMSIIETSKQQPVRALGRLRSPAKIAFCCSRAGGGGTF